MTGEEFKDWSRRLFVAFPGLWEWLQKNSPDPKATQALWRKTLMRYSLAECDAVLDAWSTGTIESPPAYEREKIHLCVQAVCEMERSRAQARRERDEHLSGYDARQRRKRYQPLPGSPYTDAGMAAVFSAGQVEHRKMLRGEITEQDYRLWLDTALAGMDNTTHETPPPRPFHAAPSV